jgi:hypothetical protein
MNELTELKHDDFLKSDISKERILVDNCQEYNNLETNNGDVCEYVDCFNKATRTIEVKVGTLGAITLFLCNQCINKFKEY